MSSMSLSSAIREDAGANSAPAETVRIPPGRSARPTWGERIELAPPPPGGRRIDLGAVEFVEPTLALRLAAAEAQHKRARELFAITPPAVSAARRYLARVGLARAMGLEEEDPGGDILLPVSALHRGGQVDRVGEQIDRVLSEKLPKRFASGAHELKRAFSELGDNACTHGHSEHGGFALIQRFGRDRVVVAVGDLGIGIPGHLGRALPGLGELDEGRWIRRALQPGVSSEGEGGDGLAQIVAAIRRSQFADSELRIWSGGGRVRVRQSGGEANAWLVESDTPGTWAEFELSARG
jgi:hypothetical protein